MKSLDEDINALSRAILSEARGEADQVVADAHAKADTVRQQAKEQAERERREILDRAKQDADRIRSQKVAATQLKARTMQLDSREKQLNKVYQSALKELPSVQQWTDYEEIAQTLLREAVTQLRANEVVVRADPKTMSHFSDGFLENLARELNMQIQRGEPLVKGTGVIVEASNGHMQYDNTLETRLKRMWDASRAQIHHLLMGERI